MPSSSKSLLKPLAQNEKQESTRLTSGKTKPMDHIKCWIEVDEEELEVYSSKEYEHTTSGIIVSKAGKTFAVGVQDRRTHRRTPILAELVAAHFLASEIPIQEDEYLFEAVEDDDGRFRTLVFKRVNVSADEGEGADPKLGKIEVKVHKIQNLEEVDFFPAPALPRLETVVAEGTKKADFAHDVGYVPQAKCIRFEFIDKSRTPFLTFGFVCRSREDLERRGFVLEGSNDGGGDGNSSDSSVEVIEIDDKKPEDAKPSITSEAALKRLKEIEKEKRKLEREAAQLALLAGGGRGVAGSGAVKEEESESKERLKKRRRA
ncbi:hypothetical protein MNV49_006058 [Pseudohyphozyma bogoriensis]|nr:hypothetical protein MNV49_006058 [Pseudohyphozyma bogoriensis]